MMSIFVLVFFIGLTVFLGIDTFRSMRRMDKLNKAMMEEIKARMLAHEAYLEELRGKIKTKKVTIKQKKDLRKYLENHI